MVTRVSVAGAELEQVYALRKHMECHAKEEVAKKPVFSAKILAIESSAMTRKAQEAIEICDRKPTTNRNKGWSVL